MGWGEGGRAVSGGEGVGFAREGELRPFLGSKGREGYLRGWNGIGKVK